MHQSCINQGVGNVSGDPQMSGDPKIYPCAHYHAYLLPNMHSGCIPMPLTGMWPMAHAQSDHHLEHKATTRAPSMRMLDIDFMHTLLPILWCMASCSNQAYIYAP